MHDVDLGVSKMHNVVCTMFLISRNVYLCLL